MPDKTRKRRAAVSKHRGSPPPRKNRYYRRSKLSEYSFLRILEGFAEDRTVAECADGMRVSEKTVRAVFMALRRKLVPATLTEPYQFGGTGFFLFQGGRLSERGKAVLKSVAESEIFHTHMTRHCPRLADPRDGKSYLFEVAVRLFCNIALQKTAEHLYPAETRSAAAQMQGIALWISENRETERFHEKHGQLVARFGKVVDAMPVLLELEELQALRSKSAAHRYPAHILKDELRRYLLRDPL